MKRSPGEHPFSRSTDHFHLVHNRGQSPPVEKYNSVGRDGQ